MRIFPEAYVSAGDGLIHLVEGGLGIVRATFIYGDDASIFLFELRDVIYRDAVSHSEVDAWLEEWELDRLLSATKPSTQSKGVSL